MKESPKLTDRQKLFCDNYLSNGFHSTNAYRDAYDRHNENEYNSIRSCASQLLDKQQVQDYINSKLEENEITMNEALAKLSYLIKQHSDLSVCHQAIKTYLKLKDKLDDNVKVDMVYTANFS